MPETTDDNPAPTDEGWATWWARREAAALKHRVLHHPPSDDAVWRHQAVREATLTYGHALLDVLPASAPETVGALTMLTDGVMALANAAIARHVSGADALEDAARRLAANPEPDHPVVVAERDPEPAWPTKRCRGATCDADIIWTKNAATGRSMPVDLEPSPDGNVELAMLPDGRVESVVHGQPPLDGRPLRLNHFVTCPDSDSFRG